MSAQTVYDENPHLSAVNLKLSAEIERLQLANKQSMAQADMRSAENCKLRQENERLTAALQEIADMPPLRSFNSDGSPGGVYDAEQKVARRALEQ